MVVNLENCQDVIDVSEKFINNLLELVKDVLYFEEVHLKYEINILFVDNDSIKNFNFQYRNIDRETDCLSFPMLNYEKGKVFRDQYKNFKFRDYELDGDKLVLGDILISLEKAMTQSIQFNHSFEREVSYLIIHSLLHLLGYDHINDSDKIIMRNREKKIIRHLSIPYK